MSKVVLTVYETTVAAVIATVRALGDHVDALEIRVDRLAPGVLSPVELEEIRQASSLPMIYTRRSSGARSLLTTTEISSAIRAGFDLVDVELRGGCEELVSAAGPERVVLSHHDFDGTADLMATIVSMDRLRTAHKKLAVTPRTFAENLSLLEILAARSTDSLTLLGMGARGLYSRILAPFFGSELVYVSRDRRSAAAPGQIDLGSALEIYGDGPVVLQKPEALFAVVGNPAGHSRSPTIHNPIFRDRGIAAAYSIIECERLAPVVEAMLSATPFAPRGISITAPFKRDAFEIAESGGWPLDPRAAACRSVNTLVRFGGDAPGILRAYNTDVDGFSAAFDLIEGSRGCVAVLGAGGTARAAICAAKPRGLEVAIYNRTAEKARSLAAELGVASEPFSALAQFEGLAVVNTLTAGAELRLPDSIFRRDGLFVDVGYADAATDWSDRAREAGMTVFDGLDLLVAQAVDQSRLFVLAVEGGER